MLARSLNDDCTWIFLNFLIIALCSSLANYSFNIFLIPLPAVHLSANKADFLSNNL